MPNWNTGPHNDAAKGKLPELPLPSHGAIYMLERGFKILPIVPGGKTPLEKGWQENSKRADEGTVQSTYDNRNWAVHPGLAEKFHRKFGGLCALFVDGVGDLCKNLKDEGLANELVDELYSLAIRYSCPLVGVLHENHASETGKTRGHFGSQLERKAASNLRLEKHATSGVIQLWGERLRRGHIAKGDGPSFIWSKEKQMHVTCMSVREVGDLESEIAIQNQKTACVEFLKTHLPEVGAKIGAKELNKIAREAGHGFADNSDRADRFVQKVQKCLGHDEGIFRICREQGKTGPWMIARVG